MMFLIPLILFVVMFKNRHNTSINIKFTLGYLMLGYSDKHKINKFWDLMQMYKRMSSIVMLNYFSSLPNNQGLLMIFVILIYITILKQLKPYKSKKLYYADSRVSTMQCFIFVVSLILLLNGEKPIA